MSELLKIGFFSSKLFKIVKRIVKVVNFFKIVKNCQKKSKLSILLKLIMSCFLKVNKTPGSVNQYSPHETGYAFFNADYGGCHCSSLESTECSESAPRSPIEPIWTAKNKPKHKSINFFPINYCFM